MSSAPCNILRVRPGVPGDAAAMLALKRRLRMQPDRHDAAGTSSRGGFLLGSTESQYEALLAGALVELLHDGPELVGFVTALPDAALRASDLWRRRDQIAGDGGVTGPALLQALDTRTLGYIDQLAVLPDLRYRLAGPALAYRALTRLFAAGSELVFATIVTRPIRNLATLPLLAAVGALRIGAVDEFYPEAGPITSDVYCLTHDGLRGDPDDRRRNALRAAIERRAARLVDPGT